MEVESKPRRRRQIQQKKYHVDLSEDPQIKAISEAERVEPKFIPALRDDDVHNLLDRYATDPKCDLYTVADSMHISSMDLYKILHSEKYREEYDAARAKRGQIIAQDGYQTACLPFELAMSGQEVNMPLVAAAKLKSNYAFMYAQSLDPELRPSKEVGSGGGQTVVVVNTGVQLNV